MTKSVMEKDVVHPIMPAMNAIMGLKDGIAEAAPVLRRWLDMTEVGQAVENPFSRIGHGEFLKTVQKVEWALQRYCPPWRTDN